eukprot:SAG31_NODE_787_length_12094_cov_27.048270_1_plen_33_part_00
MVLHQGRLTIVGDGEMVGCSPRQTQDCTGVCV